MTTSTALAPLCEDCGRRWSAWLDYRLAPVPIQLCTPGRSTARAIQEGQQHRFELWRTTIRNQQALIAGICREGRCPTAQERRSPDATDATAEDVPDVRQAHL